LTAPGPAPTARKLHVALIGTRGIPNAHGGFEQFADNLVREPLWPREGVQFDVYGETPDAHITPWARAVHVPYGKRRDPLAFYAWAIYRARRDADLILCCGVGVSLVALWPRLIGLPLVVNPDGCEWRRSKWSAWIRGALYVSYIPALAAANRVVLDAEALREDFGVLARRKGVYIAYQGPTPGVRPLSPEVRTRFGITRPYVLVIARLEPENNIAIAVEAVRRCQSLDLECLIVGPTTTPHFQQHLAGLASDRVRFVGGIYEAGTLDELRGGCLAYLHGHTVGGTNPSLVEALARSAGPVLCHDNKYNREVAGTAAMYFTGADDLEQMLRRIHATRPPHTPVRDARFEPRVIAERYLALFREVTAGRPARA
jgi:glycosyltransferase involved in cell wall biosynthesis